MPEDETGTVAVLIGGGIESAALVGTLLEEYARDRPIDVRSGLRGEEVEPASARAFPAKCAERRKGFAEAVVADRTPYAEPARPQSPGSRTPCSG
ncbi:hypothetical protein [Paludisphaera mucosa]|uniref:Uncharacterized protein n=1 Tax=Paludisphaera mucosa TaxID=3030827 RepID=A0ABT6F4F2_9BACT|nr:hypothetical protein [Paludisphaera mucosa]MDG3002463.1 hypothetical protein [Paludisphaera mucosa]